MRKIALSLISACLLQAPFAIAKIPGVEAERLGADLTPIGAEAAGNGDETIPAWTGGLKEAPQSYVEGQHETNPFTDDRPLFVITQDN